jgi:chromosomal replication initiator protein
VNPQLEHIHSRIHTELRAAVDESTYRIWLEPVRVEESSSTTLVLSTSTHTLEWLQERFSSLLARSAQAVLGPHVQVALTTRAAGTDSHARLDSPTRRHDSPQPDPQPGARGNTVAQLSAPIAARLSDLPPNPRLNFARFVIGESNRLAHGAALTVAEAPGQGFNPLFICGPPGVGKTHLLHSIASFLVAHAPTTVVRLSASESFTNEFLSALHANRIESFKAHFRRADVLLIDDIQFLERKTHTEEEFFHTFNALYELGSQIVMTSDRPPRDLRHLEDRLRERFEAGLVADIHPPDHSTRTAILRKKVNEQDVKLADNTIIDLLATRITTSVRALEGTLIRIVAVATLTDRAITADLAKEVLGSLAPRTSPTPPSTPATTIYAIQQATCKHFQISREELLSNSRTRTLAWPRQLAMYLARQLTSESLPAIGRSFGGRDHTTVLHACRRTQERLTSDPRASRTLEALHGSLHPPKSS